MEAVSAAKMRKSQETALSGRGYARAAASILRRLSGAGATKHPLMHRTLPAGRQGPVSRAVYVVMTSDKGLAGNLNNGVLRAATSDLAERGLDGTSAQIVAVGKKAAEYFKKRGFVVDESAPRADDLARRFALGEVDLVMVAYQNFISTFEQRPTVRQLFPLTVEELERVVGDIVPKRGAYATVAHEGPAPAAYSVEPSEDEVLGAILPRLADIILYHARLEAEASEHSARMIAMKSASDKAEEMTGELTRKFNKARQAAITREVSEIIGGMETLV